MNHEATDLPLSKRKWQRKFEFLGWGHNYLHRFPLPFQRALRCVTFARERERDEAEEDTSASMEEAYWETTTVLLTDFPDHQGSMASSSSFSSYYQTTKTNSQSRLYKKERLLLREESLAGETEIRTSRGSTPVCLNLQNGEPIGGGNFTPSAILKTC